MTPEQVYEKAYNLEKRIPELEAIISKNARYSFYYAQHVIKDRFILAEPVISKDVEFSYYYAYYIIKGRWELGEPAISSFGFSYFYARDVIKGKLPDFMHNALLLSNDESAKNYIEFLSNPDSPNNKI